MVRLLNEVSRVRVIYFFDEISAFLRASELQNGNQESVSRSVVGSGTIKFLLN